MSNLAKPSTELQQILTSLNKPFDNSFFFTLPKAITKEFQSSEWEVLTYLLQKPKPFRQYTNADRQALGMQLIVLSHYLGIKEIPSDNQRKSLVNGLCEELPNFTYQELNKAIQMASMGRFPEIDNNHYQHLSPMYLSSMVNSYKTYKKIIYQKYQRLQGKIRREAPPKKVSEKDMFYIGLDLVQNEFDDYIGNTEQYCDSEYRSTQFKHIYDYLTKHKLLDPKKLSDIEFLKAYIISWFNAIQKKEITPREYISKRFKVSPTNV